MNTPDTVNADAKNADPMLSPDAAPSVEATPSAGGAATRDAFCTRCGVSPEAGDHSTCQRWLASEEPPRFCAQCGRRMKVQIIPTGWAAECSRHGETSGGAGV